MKRITKIPENKGNAVVKKLRVAAYCRVSTANDEQLVSLAAQKAHYENYIKANDEWEFAGLYYDEGLSGTKKEKRDGLLSMIADCEKGQIDLVITKSISRFARNTTDCLEMVRKLLDLNIYIYFEKENLNTGAMESELMLSILSSLAESESVSIAENSKWAVKRRFQNGTFIISYPPYGYANVDGKMVIVPEQAEIVKKIFRDTLAGKSTHAIQKELNERGVPTKKGGKWTHGTINAIINNEKYIGDALLQKTYTVDFLTKKRVQNNGIVPQYYVENSHEPIIPRDLYMQVQEEMARRANLHSGAKRKKRVYSSKYALSSIVYCPKCGEIYRRIAWNNRGKHSTVWRCCTRVEHGPKACDASTIQEADLQAAVVKAINLALGSRDAMMSVLQKNIEIVILQGDEKSIEGINAKSKELQKELLRLANSKKDYGNVAEEIERLRDLKQKALSESAEREGLKQRIVEMREFLETQPVEISEYDELLVRRLIEKVTVYGERFEVEFKSGTTVDVEK